MGTEPSSRPVFTQRLILSPLFTEVRGRKILKTSGIKVPRGNLAVGEDSLPARVVSLRHERGREPTEGLPGATAGASTSAPRNDTHGTRRSHAKHGCRVGGRLANPSDAHGGRSPLERCRGAWRVLLALAGQDLHRLVRNRPLPGGGAQPGRKLAPAAPPPDQGVAPLEPVYGRVEHRRQEEGDYEPTDEGPDLPEQEERAKHHGHAQEGYGHRAHHLGWRGARPPGIHAWHGSVGFRGCRFGVRLCLRLRLRLGVPLWVLVLVHGASLQHGRVGYLHLLLGFP